MGRGNLRIEPRKTSIIPRRIEFRVFRECKYKAMLLLLCKISEATIMAQDMSKKTLVTSALIYANGPVHIGHMV